MAVAATFKNFCGLCSSIQFKPYVTSKMELFVTKIGNSWKLFLTVVTQLLDPSLKCIDKFTILAKIFQTD